MYILSEDNLKEISSSLTPNIPCINGVSIIDLIIAMSANNAIPVATPVAEPTITEIPVTDVTI